MIAGQIRRLSSALEPLPANNKCLGNQKGVGGGGEGWGAGLVGGSLIAAFSVKETATTQRTVENSQLGGNKTKRRRVKEISWPLGTGGTNRNGEFGDWGSVCVREGEWGGEGGVRSCRGGRCGGIATVSGLE